MLTYTKPNIEEFDRLFDLMRDETSDYLKDSLWMIGLTMSAFRSKFKSVGEVVEICHDEEAAGFYWIEQRDDILHLHGLILRREFQGRGLGVMVMDHIERQCGHDVSAIELGVYHDNLAARKLYDRMGYKTVRTLDDVHFDVMRKHLSKRKAARNDTVRR